jgi:EAL domain-containing protein (putative c-di-GMP-specific phosphodiesterase class I)
MTVKTENPGGSQADVRQERDRFVAFSFAAADLLLEIEPDHGRIRFVSGAAHSITGKTSDALTSESLYNLLLPSDRNLLHRFLGRIRHGGRMQPIPVKVVRGPGDHRLVLLGACRLPYNENFYISIVQVNKGALREADGSIRDENTGLLDKDSFADKAQELLAQQTEPNARLTFIELPELNTLIPRLSEERVDELYSSIASYLRAASVDGDAAAIIEPNKYGVIHNAHISRIDLQDYIAELTREFDPSHQGIAISSSEIELNAAVIGAEDTARAFVYCINKFAQDGAEKFTLSALSESIGGMMEEAVGRLSTFKSSMNGDQFRIVFQPIVALTDSTIHHYEALSRFDGGRSPFQVISFAEEVGMIQEFDLAVCQKVLDHILSLEALKKKYTIAINLSAQSLESSIFLESLRQLLAPHKLLRRNIMFELTESSQIHNFEYVNNALQTLRRDGHHVCLDDVGAGATSFHYIRSLHVDYIKIDGSYIRTMAESARDAAFVRAIATLAHDLQVKTIAEMVEREEEATLLQQMNVDYAQGYLFGRPEPLFAEIQPKVAVKR